MAPGVRPLRRSGGRNRRLATAAEAEAVVKEAAALAAGVSPSTPLKSLAAEKKLAVTTSRRCRAGSARRLGAAGAGRQTVFGKAGRHGNRRGRVGAYVAQLDQIKDPGAPTPALAAQLANELTRSMKLDLAGEFTAALRQRFPVKIDQAAIDRAF